MSAWYMVAVLILFYFLNSFDRTVLSLMVPHVKEDMGASDTQVGLLLGMAFAVFYGFFGWPIGALIDRFSRRAVLFTGVLVWSAATIACGIAATYGELLLARMVLGIGEASLMPAAHALMADRFPRERLSMAMSIFYFGGIFGSSASTALGGIAVSHFAHWPGIALVGGLVVRGWQMPFIVLGTCGVLSAALAFTFRAGGNEPVSRGTTTTSFGSALKDNKGALAAIFGSFVTTALLLFAIVLWTPTFMARAYGWQPDQIGISYGAVHLVGSGLGTLVFGALVDRLFSGGMIDAHLRVFGWCTVVGAPCALAAFLCRTPICSWP